jgi:hypothetical protein
METCCQSTEPVLNSVLHSFIVTHVLLHANGLYSVDYPPVFNPVRAKCQNLPSIGKLLYLSAYNISWHLSQLHKQEARRENIFPTFHILRFSYIYTIYICPANIVVWHFYS